MGSSNQPNSDDVPDLTLPERADIAPKRTDGMLQPWRPSDARTGDMLQPWRPSERVPQTTWRVGDRVLAPWEPMFLYVGRIVQLQDGQAQIEFGDGDAGWVLVDQIRALLITPGQEVLSRRNMGPYHFPGKIVDVRGDEVCVEFTDGYADEWTTIAALRIPCQVTGPAAAPTKFTSHLAFFDNVQPGDRVWAPWTSGILFPGSVDRIQEPEAHIHFDDDDHGWVLMQQLLPLDLPPGLRVMARWKRGLNFFPGTIGEVQNERVFVQYDDGDKEWTTVAQLALPCQPYGPDARPTKTAVRWQALSGWVIPIGLAVLFAFTRAGCR